MLYSQIFIKRQPKLLLEAGFLWKPSAKVWIKLDFLCGSGVVHFFPFKNLWFSNVFGICDVILRFSVYRKVILLLFVILWTINGFILKFWPYVVFAAKNKLQEDLIGACAVVSHSYLLVLYLFYQLFELDTGINSIKNRWIRWIVLFILLKKY